MSKKLLTRKSTFKGLFKVGDLVRVSYNNCIGEVVFLQDFPWLPYVVSWSNPETTGQGLTSHYEDELELVFSI